VEVKADILNIRDGPGTNYQDIGDLHKGDKVEVKGRLLHNKKWSDCLGR